MNQPLSQINSWVKIWGNASLHAKAIATQAKLHMQDIQSFLAKHLQKPPHLPPTKIPSDQHSFPNYLVWVFDVCVNAL